MSLPTPAPGERPVETDSPPTQSGDDNFSPPTALPGASVTPLSQQELTMLLGGKRPEIPGYEILDELGRGGMGVVYKARQIRLNRVVAIKMILHGDHARSEEHLRFLSEAEAIAAVKHPGIVQVYEFGAHAGLPYFALEFCSGGSLADRLGGTPLPPRETARIVELIACAMHAAHEKGVVHRDLKPANVLIDETGAPRITDFGLARRVEGGSGLTQTGAVMGTPSYMAPEQAQGEHAVGPAADLYALGAILYDCLTGRPPFRAASSFETLQQVVGQEPVPPRRLNPGVPRDLETICLKCLHKDRTRRYASAAELAADLRRFQSGKPVEARPVGELEKTWKWVKRNPVVAAMTAAMLLLLVGSSAGIYAKYLDARQRKNEADELRIAAEQFSQQARRTLDEAGKDDDKTRHVPGAQLLRRELMQSTLRFYKDFAAYYPEDESLRSRLADTHLRLAVATGRVRPIKEAMQSFEEGTRILQEQIAREPENVEYKVKLGEAYFELGQLAFEREQYADAETILVKAEKLLTPLAAEQPENAKVVLCLAGVNHRLDGARWNLGGRKPAEAVAFCAANIRRLDALLERQPDSVDGLYWRGKFANTLAVTYDEMKQPQAYARHLDDAVGRFTQALRLSPDRPDVLFDLTYTLRIKAWSLRGQNRLADALAVYAKAVAQAERLVARNPDVPRYKQYLALYHHQIAGFHESNTADAERFAKASRAYEQAAQLYGQLEAQDRTSPIYPRDRVQALIALAEMERNSGRRDVARDVFDRAIQAVTPAADALPANVDLVYHAARSNSLRGQLDVEDKLPAKALPYLRTAVGVYQNRLLKLKLPNRSGYLADYLQALDSARAAAAASNRADEAVRMAEMGEPVGAELLGRTHKSQWCDLMNSLAELYHKAGKTDAAVATLDKSIAVAKAVFDQAPWHWYMRKSLVNAYRQRAEIHQARGEVKEEILLRRKMLALRERLDGRSYAGDTASSNPLTLDEAKRLRSVGNYTNMKRFTVPVTIDNRRTPYFIYITQHVPQVMLDPMEDQVRVLVEDHSSKIPQEVRDSFNRLYKIALENKVSFVDLCVYALGTEGDSPTDAVVRAKAKEAINRQKKEADELKAALGGDPSNRGLRHRAARTYLDLAKALVHNREEKAGVDSWEQARLLLERSGQPAAMDEAEMALRAEVYHYLGEYRRFSGDLDAAYALHRRSGDLLQRLERSAAAGRYRKEHATALCCLANLEAARGETREMLRWLLAAAWSKDETSLRLLREVLQNHPYLQSQAPEALATACRSLGPDPAWKTAKSEELRWARDRFPDLLSTIYVLVRGGTEGNTPTWSYLAVKPSKALAFVTARKLAGFNAAEHGVLLASGPGKEPPAEVREKMKREYGMAEDFEEKLRNAVYQRQNARFTLLEKAPGGAGQAKPSMFGRLFKDDYAIIFLQGKNTMGDLVWVYVKVELQNVARMHAILKADAGFNPMDFGTVVAFGKGNPSPAAKAELRKKYPMFDDPRPIQLGTTRKPDVSKEKKP